MELATLASSTMPPHCQTSSRSPRHPHPLVPQRLELALSLSPASSAAQIQGYTHRLTPAPKRHGSTASSWPAPKLLQSCLGDVLRVEDR
ncbi:hypothetical protein SORBI_3003G159000 [Sorghum bicolor]|uniref:Uncharacterized protein n=1 Tax=Sorghum bicolor TaxID=4558 RepID=A0A1B6Q3G6_SORBI|nr:hypothetical protein SORBI_3003G159000 [Sorghum bicolor]